MHFCHGIYDATIWCFGLVVYFRCNSTILSPRTKLYLCDSHSAWWWSGWYLYMFRCSFRVIFQCSAPITYCETLLFLNVMFWLVYYAWQASILDCFYQQNCERKKMKVWDKLIPKVWWEKTGEKMEREWGEIKMVERWREHSGLNDHIVIKTENPISSIISK